MIRLSLAHSTAFEARLAGAWSSRGGLGSSKVLLFTAVSKQPETFHPNLTFVQDHLTFQPDAENPRQLGILQGRLGALEADEVVLGYVVLPESLRSRRPFDVYWDDRRIAVQFPEARPRLRSEARALSARRAGSSGRAACSRACRRRRGRRRGPSR